jgi:hypothetical protein
VMTDHDPREMFQHLPFPFDRDEFPELLGAVIQRTVLDGSEPAREVIHAPDGSWLIGDGVNDPNLPGASVATHVWHAIDRNSSLRSLASMTPGHIARRDGPGREWQTLPLEGWQDEAAEDAR